MYVLGAIVLSTAISCQGQGASSANASDSTANEELTTTSNDVPEYTINDLPRVDITKFKKNADGAYILFDGSSLEGWRGYNQTSVPEKWSIKDGVLQLTAATTGAGEEQHNDLVFAYDFKNFELSFDWKISKNGNSGVFVLAKEVDGQPIYVSSPEFQLIDNVGHPDASQGVNGNRKSASLYDMIPADPQNANPAEEWNTSKIVVNNGTITHYQNGEKVVEYTVWTPEWTALLQNSKFSQEKWPLAFELLNHVGGDSKSGLIGIQDHGNDVSLKNITVKEL